MLQTWLPSDPSPEGRNKWRPGQAGPGGRHQDAPDGEEGLQEGRGRPQREERDGGLQSEGQGPQEDNEVISASWAGSVSVQSRPGAGGEGEGGW